MARIQVVPLPTQRIGDVEETPFILILDQVDALMSFTAEECVQIEQTTGARAVWCTTSVLDAAQAVTLTDEQREQLLARVTPADA
ncbi:hypothetical protein Q9R08_05130 [Microbacterium sp. QXD-8]|uniref:Uncharacterized protein n=1 Tax=Microbacterium psychrotolerans TaxID=3068321 RepID=A0ABU0YYF2_9MICO|nr:hypothetical protein [Microbacterium sp. QXD-8]MDQ7877356.1 hypothetical protein [Microbacterium sp. QXD-8]